MAQVEPRASLANQVSGGAPHRTAHQYAREALRRAILSGDLQPGTVLVQTSIAEQLQVSTTPVREALRDLVADGLIEMDAHRSPVVKRGSRREMEEIYSLRLLLEPFCAARSAEHITGDQLDEARRLHNLMLATTDPAQWTDLNTKFHEVLTDAAKSPRLATILKSLRQSSRFYVGVRIRGAEQIADGNADHEAILKTLESRDTASAREAARRHFEKTMQEAAEELDQ